MRICGQGSRSFPLIATELGLLLLIRATSLLFLAFLSLGSSQCVGLLSALSLDNSPAYPLPVGSFVPLHHSYTHLYQTLFLSCCRGEGCFIPQHGVILWAVC